MIALGVLAEAMDCPTTALVLALALAWYGGEIALARIAGWHLSPLYPAQALLRDLLLPILTRLLPLALIVAVVCMMQTAAVVQSFPSDPSRPENISRDFAAVGAGSILAALLGLSAHHAGRFMRIAQTFKSFSTSKATSNISKSYSLSQRRASHGSRISRRRGRNIRRAMQEPGESKGHS